MNAFLKYCPISLRQLGLLSVLCFVIAGCGDDDIRTTGDGSLLISPSTLNFSNVVVGESTMSTIILENDGDSSIRLSELDLGENPNRSGSHDGFEILNPWTDSETLNAGETYILEIEYSPQDPVRYEGLLTFRTNLADMTNAEVEIRAARPAPELLADDTVSFDRTPTDSTEWRLTEIQNIGYADLEISDIYLAQANDFSLAFPVPADDGDGDENGLAGIDQDVEEPPSHIAAGESTFVRVYFTAPDEEFQADQLQIETNAPNAQPRHLIAVTANSDAPCLRLQNGDDTIDFGLASVGRANTKHIVLENCSRIAHTVINDIALGEAVDDGDTFGEGGDIKFAINHESLPSEFIENGIYAIPPDSSVSFTMAYSPDDEQVDHATLRVQSNDETGPLLADVIGEGANLECPNAVAEASIVGSGQWSDDFIFATPLDEIEFDGTYSDDPDGTSVTYEWALTHKPINSTAQINNPETATPRLITDIAGTFVVELTVYDGHGIASCEPSIITIEVSPEADIHVELTWDVPSSPTGTGVDLDLHYLHPNGQWSDPPWGVYWFNSDPTDDWQDGSDISLDIDDRYGEEPENLNHDNPDHNHDYSVGVYYFDDPVGYGATDARIRIYLGNSLAYEGQQRLETPGSGAAGATVGDFWYIADILVEPGGVLDLNLIDEFYEDGGFPD